MQFKLNALRKLKLGSVSTEKARSQILDNINQQTHDRN